ncbi:MAG: hypothetical protein IIY06_11440 [Proteobacteria bacterium]|jgi:hypothetical protein|nr:hypothetical protein [Pseudomonadota bacterium]
MNRISLKFAALSITALVLTLSACSNEHARFCQDAASKMCRVCASCGADGMKKCGLLEAQNTAECETTLLRICEAYEVDYNREVARNCLTSLDQATCAMPKPEACSWLF